MAEKLSFWARIPTTKLVAVLAVASSLMTVGATELVKAFVARGESRYQRDVAAASTFRDEARLMEALVANYVSQVIDQKPSSEAARALEANLLRQNQMMRELVARNQSLEPYAREYELALIELQNTIPDSGSVVSMRNFWEKTSRLLVLRNGIFLKLREYS